MKKLLILGLSSFGLFISACSNNSTTNTDEEKDSANAPTIADEVNTQKDTARDYLLSGAIEQDIYYLLPEGLIQAEVMKVDYNKRYKDIVLRLKNNASKHKERFEEIYAEGKEKGVVEYDPGLGITEQEYDYINNYRGEFVKVADVNLVSKIENKDIILSCDKISLLNNMKFAMQNYFVTLNNVACQYEGKFEVVDDSYPGGLKKGHLWKYENITGGDNKVEQVYEVRLAELKNTGNIMMYIGIHDVGAGDPVNEEFVLIYKPLLKQ